MEEMIMFNGVRVLLTTGRTESQVQNWFSEADLVVSVQDNRVALLKTPQRSEAAGPEANGSVVDGSQRMVTADWARQWLDKHKQ